MTNRDSITDAVHDYVSKHSLSISEQLGVKCLFCGARPKRGDYEIIRHGLACVCETFRVCADCAQVCLAESIVEEAS